MVLEPPTSATDTTTTTTDSERESRLASAKQLVRRVTKRAHRGGQGTATAAGYRSGDALDGLGPIGEARRDSSTASRSNKQAKKMMSTALASLLVYTIGVKCRGFNKKESYANQHMVSLSEKTALKMIRDAISNEALIKHNRNHLTRVYPSMLSFARLHASRNFVRLICGRPDASSSLSIGRQPIWVSSSIRPCSAAMDAADTCSSRPHCARRTRQDACGKMVRFRLDLNIVSAQQLPKKAKAGAGKEKDKEKGQASSDNREPIDPFVVVSLLAPSWLGKAAQRLAAESTTSCRSKGGVGAIATASRPLRRNSFGCRSGRRCWKQRGNGNEHCHRRLMRQPTQSTQPTATVRNSAYQDLSRHRKLLRRKSRLRSTITT